MRSKKSYGENNPNYEILKTRVSMGGRCESFCPYGTKNYIGSYSCQNECAYFRGVTETPGYSTVKCAFKVANKKEPRP